MTEPARRGEPVATTTPDLVAERVQQLQALFPDVVTEGRVDFDKLRAALGAAVNGEPERYSFSWAGKRDALHLLQMPSRATLVPTPDESVSWDDTQHLFIEGDNLEVLKLLYKAYFGRVKMIYIDPPYNTGNDFIYPDKFADPLDTYLRLTGQRDENGNGLTSNPETNGRYHSAWLSMMYPRLFVARQLLRDDGVIFVSIDDHEVHHLRMLMNEIFGEENFVALVVAQTNPRGRTLDRFFAKTHEYLLVFARDATQQAIREIPKNQQGIAAYNKHDEGGDFRELELRNRNPVFNRRNRPNLFYPFYANPETGEVRLEREGMFTVEILPRNSANEDGCWTWGKSKSSRNLQLLLARQVRTGAWRVFRKDYLPLEGATTKEKALWLDKEINHENGKEELGRLFGRTPFDFPKSVALMRKCIAPGSSTNDEDIILDFFAGSCSTAQAVLELNREDGGNRRFVMVQLPEPTPADSTARQQGFETIADVGKERIRRVAAKLRDERNGRLDLRDRATPEDLGFRVFKLTESHYRRWTGSDERDVERYIEQLEQFIDPLLDGWQPEGVIWEAAIKEGYGLNTRIEPVPEVTTNTILRVSDPDKGQFFLICLDDTFAPETLETLTPAISDAPLLTKDDLLICRDVSLDDTLISNVVLRCRLKTI